jgi:hypothetical protein
MTYGRYDHRIRGDGVIHKIRIFARHVFANALYALASAQLRKIRDVSQRLKNGSTNTRRCGWISFMDVDGNFFQIAKELAV